MNNRWGNKKKKILLTFGKYTRVKKKKKKILLTFGKYTRVKNKTKRNPDQLIRQHCITSLHSVWGEEE